MDNKEENAMLTKMYLTNFLSFKERTEIDFTASKYSILGKTNVYENEFLKGALFIGPNASGKSEKGDEGIWHNRWDDRACSLKTHPGSSVVAVSQAQKKVKDPSVMRSI